MSVLKTADILDESFLLLGVFESAKGWMGRESVKIRDSGYESSAISNEHYGGENIR